MIKKFFYIGLMLFFGILPSHSMVKEYFNTFYYNYLESRKIDQNNFENFDFLHTLSNNKVYWMNKHLNNPNSSIDKETLIALLDEEYLDLKENLDFEAEYVSNCPLSKRQERAFKRAHKKFMRKLKKECLRCAKASR